MGTALSIGRGRGSLYRNILFTTITIEKKEVAVKSEGVPG